MSGHRARAAHSASSESAGQEKLLWSIEGLSRMLNISVRQLRRMDAAGEIPGRVTVGRLVRFKRVDILAWVERGLPGRAAK